MTGSPDLVARAAIFAQNAHGMIDQRRKYTDEPYDVHLAAVAAMVDEAGGTPTMIAAAWLHDVVEDTPVTLSVVESEFGAAVAALVDQLTDVSRPEDGNRATRKALDRDHLAGASDEAKTIKLADLIDNTRSIVEHDPRFARVYLREKRALLPVLVGGNPALYAAARQLTEHYFADAAQPASEVDDQ